MTTLFRKQKLSSQLLWRREVVWNLRVLTKMRGVLFVKSTTLDLRHVLLHVNRLNHADVALLLIVSKLVLLEAITRFV